MSVSQKGWGWKGSREVSWSNPPAQAGPSQAGCPGLGPDDFWISTDGDSKTFLCNLCQCLGTLTVVKYFLQSNGFLCVLLCAHCLLSCYWAPLSTACLSILHLHIRILHPLGRSERLCFSVVCNISWGWDALRMFWGLSCAELKASWRQWKESPWLCRKGLSNPSPKVLSLCYIFHCKAIEFFRLLLHHSNIWFITVK